MNQKQEKALAAMEAIIAIQESAGSLSKKEIAEAKACLAKLRLCASMESKTGKVMQWPQIAASSDN